QPRDPAPLGVGAVRTLRRLPHDCPGRPADPRQRGPDRSPAGPRHVRGPRPVPRVLGSPLSFSESMRRRGLTASSRLLAAGEIDPEPDDVAALELSPGDKAVLLERLRLASDVPMAIERALLHPSLRDVLDEDLAAGSLHSTMEKMGRVPTWAQAWVSARLADARGRRLLDRRDPAVIATARRLPTAQN